MERQFNGVIKRWVDGDTVIAVCDLGFRLSAEVTFRVAGINTPEKGKPGYQESVLRVNQLAPSGTSVLLICSGHDKYGRWVASVHTSDGTDIGNLLLVEGLAVPYV